MQRERKEPQKERCPQTIETRPAFSLFPFIWLPQKQRSIFELPFWGNSKILRCFWGSQMNTLFFWKIGKRIQKKGRSPHVSLRISLSEYLFPAKKRLGGLKTSQLLFCGKETGRGRLFFWRERKEREKRERETGEKPLALPAKKQSFWAGEHLNSLRRSEAFCSPAQKRLGGLKTSQLFFGSSLCFFEEEAKGRTKKQKHFYPEISPFYQLSLHMSLSPIVSSFLKKEKNEESAGEKMHQTWGKEIEDFFPPRRFLSPTKISFPQIAFGRG